MNTQSNSDGNVLSEKLFERNVIWAQEHPSLASFCRATSTAARGSRSHSPQRPAPCTPASYGCRPGTAMRSSAFPQGSPLSPLLSNIYVPRFILGWKHLGHARRLGAHIVSYADDLVICCKGSADEARLAMQNIMRRLELTVNERMTHVCRVPEQYFDFSDYTSSRFYSATGRTYIRTHQSKKSVQWMRSGIREQSARSRTLLTADEVVLA